ncbi:MAG: DUF4157 domain-containing protein [Desulfovibrionaceae bacterium]|nr:DUF4157 domain-containing protein [Desulfovibrionaceae bacterium]
MQTGKRQHKNGSSQFSAAGRRAEVRQDSAHRTLLSPRLTPRLDIQPKLSIGQPGDTHELEADRVADQVVSQPLQRTPSFDQPVTTKSDHQRPPAITPVIQQQGDEPAQEENQLQEEEQLVQGMGLQFQEESVSEGEEVQEIVRLQRDDEVLQLKGRPITSLVRRKPIGRPASRTPPIFSLQRGGNSARAPPLMLQCMAVQPQISDKSLTPSQCQTGEVRPGLVQCRAPPTQARTEESESRLDRELRQSRGGGLPLPEKTRIQMESGIGADFSNVRVHTDAGAEQMNTMLGSQAFATGNNIFFASGKYDPESLDGQRLLAHELTHTVQQNASPRIQLTPALGPRGPPVQQSSHNNLQGGFIGDRLNEYARHVPGWELFTVIIGYNPLTEQDVSRTPQNFLRGFMGLVVGGTALYDKLNENGLIDDAFNWLSSQLNELDLSWSRLRDAIDAAWEDMDFIRWDPFDYNLRVLKRHLSPIWNDVKTFAGRVIDKTVELVRTTMLTPLVNFIKQRTRAYPLLSVILGSDPITGEQVDRSLYNIVSAFLMLTESGEEYLNKLNESGKLQELSDWLDAEIERLDVSVETVTNAFSEAWELLDLNGVLHPIDTFTRLYNIFSGPVTRLFNFVVSVAMKVLGLIKDWLLGLLKEYADDIPGYPLLRVILGQDPLTGEEVPRTAENFIRGFLSFVPGGMEKFNNLKESGAIDKAFAWLEEAITSLGLIGEAFANAFTQIWETFSINDLADPIAAFERVVAIFTEPVRMLIDFAIEVGMKVLEFIFEGVLGPTGARVLAIMKKARSTFITIIRDPMAFVGHLIEALAKGFRQFSSNILTHLRNGLIAWLTGTLSGAGIQLPERFDFKGIVSLVLQILGLTWPRIREKLVRRLGERTVAILETSFDIIRLLITEGPGALWEKLMEHVSNLKDTVMEGIRNFIITRIVTAAVTKLATMWNPAGAVIQAILGIYNTVMFFIERINQILDLVDSVVNSVSKIAGGAIQDAADFVEQAMGRTIPVILGFLARLIGLGNISSAIQNIIRRVQATVDRGLDRVLDWIVSQGRRLLNRLRGRGDPTAQQAVDPANMTPDQKKAAAKQELEQWIRGGDRQGSSIQAKLPELKQKYQLSDLRMEMTSQGPRIGYYASAGEFTYFFEGQEIQNVESTTSAGIKTVNSAAGVPTPKGVISQKYPDQIANGAFLCSAATLDRPGSVVAEQTGVGSSANRGSSSVQGNAGYVGIDEEMIMAGHRNTSYRGGHLIAYAILQENSNHGYNLAPQVNRFNAPAYFKIFEEVAMMTPTTVEISVNVGYAMHSYQVDQQTLVDRGILTHIDLSRDWTISLAKRIPNSWNATVVAMQGSLVEGGVSATTDTARGVPSETGGEMQSRIVTTEAAFNSLQVDGDGDTERVQKWNSFKMLITEGGQRNNDGSITTGGGGRTRLSIQAEQLDFTPAPVQSQPANPAPAPAIGQAKLEVGSQGDSYEQEADSVADRVVQNASAVNQTISTYTQGKPQLRQGPVSAGQKNSSTAVQPRSEGHGGNPLPTQLQTGMEAGIGADLGHVRVHTDSPAVQMSREMGAKAFTQGNHIYFNQGQFAPETSSGRHLLAHELIHTVQQGSVIRRQPIKAPVTEAETTATDKKDPGPLVLGGAPMPGLESPVEGEIQSPAQAEQQAEAEAGIKKGKKEPSSEAQSEGKGGKGKKKPAGEAGDKQPAKELATKEKGAGEEKTAAEPKTLKGGSSDGMLGDFMTSTASDIGASYPTLGAGISETLKAEKKQEADSAPKLVARAGKGKVMARAPPTEESGAQEAAIEEKEPQQARQQKVPAHKALAKPVNNARNNKALDQSPAGSWISWFKDRVNSFMSGIRTKDDGVNTRAGKPPKAELKGDADPKRADRQRSDGDRQTGAEKDKVSSQIKANPGKERIQPAPVDATNEVKIEAAVPEVETAKQDDMTDYVNMPLPESVRKKADLGIAPLLEKSLAKPQADVKKASDKRNSEKQAEVSKAKSEVTAQNEKADQDQQNIVASSRSDVASEQKKGLDEADQQIKKYRKEADKEQSTLRDSVKKRVKEDENKAAAKLKKAEEDAEKEKKKKEAEAAAKKKELKKKQKKKSWWDRVKDAVKSVVKAITKAIDGIFNALRKAVKFIIDTAKKAALALIELGRKFVVGLLNTFRKLLKSLVSNLIGKVFPKLARKINKGIDKVVDTAIKGVNKVAKALKKGVEALANALGKILDKILSVFQTALKAAVQIVGAVLTGDFAEAAKIAFYAACDIIGINPKTIINFMEKAGESLGRIFKSPSTFFNNVAKGVKKGINQFVAKIKQHLLNGLIAWLTGAMGDVQITLPKKFDVKGIFSLVTQILGLTYDNIRAKVVKKLGPKGEKIVSTLEKTFVLVKELITKGPVALWDRVKKSLSSLKDKVMEGIRNAVIEKVVKAGVVWLISMLNPASALVKAIKMLYDLVMFFVERWEQIVAFAKSIWNSVTALANGQIGVAANAVEQALARSIPVILGLLASLLGIGGIGKSVKKVIKKIRKPIDVAVDKVVDFIFKQGKKLLGKLTGKKEGQKSREKQTPQQREKNKKACENEIRGIMSKGTTFGSFKAMITKLKKKHQVKDIRMDKDFDVKVINSAPSEIKVAIAHEIGLDKGGKLVEAKATSTGKKGQPKYDKPKPREEFAFGTINSSSDHPSSLKAVLEKEVEKHGLSLKELEYNKYFSGFPDAPARPSRVSGTIYGYIASIKKARTGTSTIVGYMGNREASFRQGSFRGGTGAYDGGHLISHSFGGPDAYYNLVPMKAAVNRQVYGGIEKFMRDRVKVEPSALPLDKKKSNLDIAVAMNYGSGTYNIKMDRFLEVATGGLKTQKAKLEKQRDENLARKTKLDEIKKGFSTDPKKALAELQRYRNERNSKKSRLKELRKTEERDRQVWSLTNTSGLKNASGLLRSRKQAMAQVNQANKILDPLAKLAAKLKKAGPGIGLIASLELRHRAITRLIGEFAEYADKPGHQGDRRLAMQGLLLRAHVTGLQKPRDLTRSLERELARMPTIPESEKEIDAKIKEYDEKIQHAIKELSDTKQAGEIKKLEGKSFAGAGSVPVHSRIPTSFSVDLNYEAVAGKGVDKAKFEDKSGTSTASRGTITVSNAPAETRLIVEEKAPKANTSKQSDKKEKESAAARATVKREERFSTSFTITQA